MPSIASVLMYCILLIYISGGRSKRHQRGGKDAKRRPHDPEDGREHDNLQAHSQRDQGLSQREQGGGETTALVLLG